MGALTSASILIEDTTHLVKAEGTDTPTREPSCSLLLCLWPTAKTPSPQRLAAAALALFAL